MPSNQIWIGLANVSVEAGSFLKVHLGGECGLIHYDKVTTDMNNNTRNESWNSFTINIDSSTSSTSGTSSNLSLYTGNLPSLYTGNLLSNNAVIQDLTQQVSDTQKLLYNKKKQSTP